MQNTSRRFTVKTIVLLSGLSAVALLAGAPASAQEFAGYTLKVKLIGGAQYEPLYNLVIPQWGKKDRRQGRDPVAQESLRTGPSVSG